ncbi:capsular polysaccharide synthesis protein [Arthrobacter zhaoxinii]|uniref:Capsular polysaccharide synthesis protein n=1 Tax=Arthrobacter zhaoxinii TaxID=2964616 RepID=A0ABY5YM38_9MICC|nr:capsular polysaccharide synthesis protein [Arthrobacter zhaoxinii]UWX96157.1 capsular polysaccharide synthesis protein [Arthrobacter zhaoxinii]
MAERAGNMGEARNLYRQGLILDPRASQADWDLLEENPRQFRERRALHALLAIRIEDMHRSAYAEAKRAPRVTENPLVFMYWGQGFDSAPEIVRACYEQAKRLHSPDSIVFLDDNNLHEWVTLPQRIIDVASVSRAAFSDVLRFELLAKHGGVWLDATCMVMRPMQDIFQHLVTPSGFFAFDKEKPGLISSWFLASNPGSYITCMTRDALRLYFGVYDKPITYFFLHQMFVFMYRLDDRFEKLWDKRSTPRADPRAVHRALLRDVGDVNLNELLAGSFVHKLTHKNKPELVSETSVQQALVRGAVRFA